MVFRLFNGEGAVIEVGKLTNAPVNTLWLYLILGMIFGIVGPLFNALIIRAQDMFQRIHGGNTTKWVLVGGLLGGVCGVLGFIEPNAAGGGFGLIPIAAAGNFSIGLLLFMFISRGDHHRTLLLLRRAWWHFCPDAGVGYVAGNGLVAWVPPPQASRRIILRLGTFAVAGMGGAAGGIVAARH
ncbi:H(+)/Cl(-) exchange transporter ClcA [Leclercia adecarboxylata]|uniref:H(+)/Cl(-) exchange transporter ClcA n=1 Tax=Leclercia adecarboxylata TaxID=83655 RepID=A0A4U9HJC5_9ENTR|nr:H(+)/Cl(-) exchange transporter ClcA [Leclercia adecarboxylata]